MNDHTMISVIRCEEGERNELQMGKFTDQNESIDQIRFRSYFETSHVPGGKFDLESVHQ